MVPIVGEDNEIGAPTTSYFAVAVARKNSTITFKTLKGRKSCHTGAGKTSGWNVPVGLLLSKDIMQTEKSCNAYTAAGEFFSESRVPSKNIFLTYSLWIFLKRISLTGTYCLLKLCLRTEPTLGSKTASRLQCPTAYSWIHLEKVFCIFIHKTAFTQQRESNCLPRTRAEGRNTWRDEAVRTSAWEASYWVAAYPAP